MQLVAADVLDDIVVALEVVPHEKGRALRRVGGGFASVGGGFASVSGLRFVVSRDGVRGQWFFPARYERACHEQQLSEARDAAPSAFVTLVAPWGRGCTDAMEDSAHR